MATAVAHFPGSLDRGPLERIRRPLAVVAALIVVIDCLGLGMHLADAVDSPFADDGPAPARARVGGPEAVVPPASVPATRVNRAAQKAQPLGCLARDSGCYPAGTVTPPANTTQPAGGTPPPTAPPTPIAQANLGIPALGSQVSLGLGDGSCTSVKLTVLALGDCPAASGEGPVVVNLGGALLGD